MSGNTFFSAARYGWHLQMKFGCAILDELCTKHLQYNRAVVVNRQFIYLYLQYGWMLIHVFYAACQHTILFMLLLSLRGILSA